MLKEIIDLPTNTIGFEATGRVTAADYQDVMIPLIEEKLKVYPKIKFLYYIDAEFERYEAKAMWDDAKLGLEHFNAWEKIAIVTDIGWLKNGVKVFRFIMPGKVRVFNINDLNNAKDWLTYD